jgi:hypothetical protein
MDKFRYYSVFLNKVPSHFLNAQICNFTYFISTVLDSKKNMHFKGSKEIMRTLKGRILRGEGLYVKICLKV